MGFLAKECILYITLLTYFAYCNLQSALVYIKHTFQSVSSVNFDTLFQEIAQPWDFVGLHNIGVFSPRRYFLTLREFFLASLCFLFAPFAQDTPPTTISIHSTSPNGVTVSKTPESLDIYSITPFLLLFSPIFYGGGFWC